VWQGNSETQTAFLRMKLEMALPFHRLMRLAPGLHLRFYSTHLVRRQAAEYGIIIQENSKDPASTAFSRGELRTSRCTIRSVHVHLATRQAVRKHQAQGHSARTQDDKWLIIVVRLWSPF
jgi:hypothetical protein